MSRLRYLKECYVSSIKAAAKKLTHVLSANEIDKFGDKWLMYQGGDKI